MRKSREQTLKLTAWASSQERRDCDQHVPGSKPTRTILCILGKDTLRPFPLLGSLGK